MDCIYNSVNVLFHKRFKRISEYFKVGMAFKVRHREGEKWSAYQWAEIALLKKSSLESLTGEESAISNDMRKGN